jgi:large subunit ribosomal protein L29
MAIIRAKDARNLDSQEIDKKLSELRLEMAKERANISVGATTTSPGRIREIRRTIARLNTIKKEKPGSK